jgi:Spy/CpxP family protein refolding chaperone
MSRHLAWGFAALLLLPATAHAERHCDQNPPPAAQKGQDKGEKKPDQPAPRQQPPKWWMDPALKAELGITEKQSSDIEHIWQKGLPQRTEARDLLEKLDSELSKMIVDGAEENAVIAQIDKVEAARLDVNKNRDLMLYRMNKLLTPDQRAKLDAKARAMREQRDRDGRRGGGSSSR